MAVQDAGASHLPARAGACRQPEHRSHPARAARARGRTRLWPQGLDHGGRACGGASCCGTARVSDADISRDVLKIAIPAALQAIQQTFRSLPAPLACAARLRIEPITEFFSDYYPDIALLSAAAPSNGAGLVVHRDERSLARR
jgi:hypothetical protein